MTTEEKLERFVALAAKTGRIWVAEDVYAELRRLPVSTLTQRGLTSLDVVPSPHLPSGSMMAVDPTTLTDRRMPVPTGLSVDQEKPS